MSTVNPDSVAQDQIRSFVDRILRLRAEQRAIKGDEKEVYAEAKGNGFDKTVLGKIVLHVERLSDTKSAAAMQEQDALFDLYLEAYFGKRPSHTHAHAREDVPPHDAETGEIIESTGASQRRAQTATGLGAGGDHLDPSSRPTATAKTDVPSDQSQASGGGQSQDNSGVRVAPVDTHSEPEAAMLPQTVPSEIGSWSASAEQASVESSATIQPETASEVPAQDGGGNELGESPLGKSNAARPASVDAHVNDGRLAGEVSNEVVTAGETAPHSLPAAAAVAPRRLPGDTWTEHTPSEPLRWHEYARCFPEHWAMSLANIKDSIREEGVREPIVRIGNEILDGRARYNCARELLIDYPVKEYDGTDPLLDVIRWNLEARQMGANERKLVATKLAKLCPDRGEEIAAAFGLDHGRAAAE